MLEWIDGMTGLWAGDTAIALLVTDAEDEIAVGKEKNAELRVDLLKRFLDERNTVADVGAEAAEVQGFLAETVDVSRLTPYFADHRFDQALIVDQGGERLRGRRFTKASLDCVVQFKEWNPKVHA